jgi:phosphatidate cytidylyltransferase
MRQRVITAIIALAVLITVLYVLPPVVAQAIVAAVMLAGAWEWSHLIGCDTALKRWIYVLAILAVLVVVTFAPGVNAELILGVSLVWWLGALLWSFFYPTRIPPFIQWFAGAAVLVPLYLALVILYQVSPDMLLFALLIVWVADSGAFFAGKAVGRVKLAPKISPGKTWEGVLGGLAAVGLLTLARSHWVETDLAVFIPFCLATACLSIVGDLTVSMFKRSAGVKDSGTLFPGHGGVLDRIDSVAAAAPLFALGITWAGLD